MVDSDPAAAAGGDADAGRLRHWLFLDGNRVLIAALVCAGVFAVTRSLAAAGVLAVGPDGQVPSMFGAGVTAGVFTLITLTLTVNQLVSSQSFVQPESLRNHYDAAAELHDSVSELGDSGPAPVRTVEFLSAIGAAIDERTESLRDQGTTGDAAAEIEGLADRLATFTGQFERISPEMQPIDVISSMGGSEYARIRNETLAVETGADLPDAVADDLEAVRELLGHVSVARQYYKTLALHQELAQLSREIIYVSVPCLLVTTYLPLLYRSSGTTVPAAALPWIVSGAFAVVFAPLAILVVHLLRVSTVVRYTVSVGPLTPPEDWPWDD